MAFFNKLNDFAKNLGEKTTDAIEAGKLTSRINAERNAAAEDLKKIGQYYYDLYLAGEETAPEILELCLSAKAHYDAAAEAQGEIDRMRAEAEAARAAAQPKPAGISCPACGTENRPGTKFCQECGARMETRTSVFCTECGADNAPGTRFCRECGSRLEAPAPAPRLCPACGSEVPPSTRFCSQCGQQMD